MFVGFLIAYIEWLVIFEDAVQSLLNMSLYDVCSLVLTEPHANQI